MPLLRRTAMTQFDMNVAQRNDTRLIQTCLQWVGLVLLMITLTACGGGGGGGSDEASDDTTTSSSGGGNSTANTPTNNNDGGSNNNGGGTNPSLVPPAPVAPPPPPTTPVNAVQLFEQTVWPIMRSEDNQCRTCHNPGTLPLDIPPFMAHEDLQQAYNAVVDNQKVDLANPANSRLVLKPSVEFHNCGGIDACPQFAAEMLAAIESWAAMAAAADAPPPTANRLTSMMVSFADGMEGANARVENNMIAAYDFSAGAGDVVQDISGVGAPMDLLIQGEMEWLPEGGLRNVNGKAQASLASSQKLIDMIAAGDQFTVEAWVIPENLDQNGPARIVSYSVDTGRRNFTLGQQGPEYNARVSTDSTGNNGNNPSLSSGADYLVTDLTHVVMTYDNVAGGRKFYINGQLVSEEDLGQDQLNWENDNIFVIGNEVTDNRLWRGIFRYVAIHNSALNSQQIAQNFDAGEGAVTTLAFDVSQILGAPGMVQMQARELDANAYVFAEPVLVTDVGGVPIRNMRIAVNNSVPVATQAFRSVDMTVLQSGQMISPLGAVIPKDLGPEMDMIHLEFEVLGGQAGTGDPYVAPLTPVVADLGVLPEYGVRPFSSVNDTMSVLTGIPTTRNVIRNRYEDLRDQLPASPDIMAFSAAQQIAIQRLAVTYCGEVIRSNNTCNAVFGSCNIANAAAKSARANSLFDNFVGELDVQPDRIAVTNEVVRLMDDLGCANGCNGQTEDIAMQASCTAVLSSGVMTIN